MLPDPIRCDRVWRFRNLIFSMTSTKPRIAFVTQRCGLEVNGGAESLCLQIGLHMSAHWDVEIITTCALDYVRWENHYPEGLETVEGVSIRRFAVNEPRESKHFDALSAELVAKGSSASLDKQEDWMRAQGPISAELLRFLEENRTDYSAFIFFGYLYATTYFGLPLVKDRAYLAPLAHDEWPIYFPMWDAIFSLPQGFIFQTPEELIFLQERFPAIALEGPISGIGIETPKRLDPARFRESYCLLQPFLLYAGRIDASKGCDEMFAWFLGRTQTNLPPYKLVLIGRETLPVPFADNIVYLGFVSEEEKWNAMAACDWMILPSRYESLSISLLETWAAGRPCLVNAGSEVLRGHCQRANGGFWFRNWEECESLLRSVDDKTKTMLGRQGRDYVRNNYSWSRIESEFLHTIGSPQAEGKIARTVTNVVAPER